MAEDAFVIGDLHLGAGESDPLEDFRQDREFVAFIDGLRGPGQTVVINGDFVDFAQIAPFDVPKPRYLLWGEASSVQKIGIAIKEHAACFEALGRFADRTGTVIVLEGNHDLDFYWPAVQNIARRAMKATRGDRVIFNLGALVYHGVHIEHGHRFTAENCPRGESFVHVFEGREYLERVWGTDFMLSFYNELEKKHPYADNVKPMLTVLYYALKNKWVGAVELLRLLVFLKKRGVPWSAIPSMLDEESPDAGAVMGAFSEEPWQRLVADCAADAGFVLDLRDAIAQLDRNERSLLADPEQVATEVEPDAVREVRQTLGLFREDREFRAAKERLSHKGVTHVVFGHTHEVVDGALGERLFNPGTWLPCLDLKDPMVMQKIKAAGGLTKEMLSDDKLYTVERRVAHIVVNPTYAARVELLSV